MDWLIDILRAIDPVKSVLVAILLLIIWVAERAQRAGIDLSDFFKEETGKMSMTRLLTFNSFIVVSWAYVSICLHIPPTAITENLIFNLTALLVVVYSGTKVAEGILALIVKLKLGVDTTPPTTPGAVVTTTTQTEVKT